MSHTAAETQTGSFNTLRTTSGGHLKLQDTCAMFALDVYPLICCYTSVGLEEFRLLTLCKCLFMAGVFCNVSPETHNIIYLKHENNKWMKIMTIALANLFHVLLHMNVHLNNSSNNESVEEKNLLSDSICIFSWIKQNMHRSDTYHFRKWTFYGFLWHLIFKLQKYSAIYSNDEDKSELQPSWVLIWGNEVSG